MSNQGKLYKYNDVIELRRGSEYVLVGENASSPLYVPYGYEFIRNIIDCADSSNNEEHLRQEFAQHGDLINALIDAGILCQELGEGSSGQCAFDSKSNNENTPSSGSPQAPPRHTKIHLYLLLSQYCNQSCIYCLNGEDTYKTKQKLKMANSTAFRAVEQFSKFIMDNGNLDIVFFGGEPLLNFDLAKKIINFCENELAIRYPKIKYTYHFTTNLTILPTDLLDLAVQRQITFLVDVDGPRELHNKSRPFADGRGSYDATVRNLNKLNELGIPYSLRSTITTINEDHVSDVVNHHIALNGQASAVIPVNPVSSDTTVFPENLWPDGRKISKALESLIESDRYNIGQLYHASLCFKNILAGGPSRWSCGALQGSAPVVDIDGNIYPCIYLVGIEDFRLGRIYDENLNYPDPELIKTMRASFDNRRKETCSGCSVVRLCGGGCPLDPLLIDTVTNEYPNVKSYVRDVTCQINLTTIKSVLWRMAQDRKSVIKTTQMPPPICV